MRLGYTCTIYRTVAFVEQAIRTLHAQRGAHAYHVVVVDNGSSREDLARLMEFAKGYPRVEVLTGHGNIGYFPGLNLGIERLREAAEPPDVILAGNDDLEFPGDFMERLEAHRALFDRWAVVAPDLVTPSGVHQNPLVRVPITRARDLVWDAYFSSFALATVIAWGARLTRRWTARPERVHDAANAVAAGPVLQALGAAYLLGPVFFRHFARLYGPTFLMREEFFLGEQLKLVGQQVYYEPGLVLRHRDHGTFDTLPVRRVWDMTRAAHRRMREWQGMRVWEREAAVRREAGWVA